jgi:hypothetical protein
MDIINFDNFRAGSHFPGCLDIEKLGNHEQMGVRAIAYCFPNSNESFVQFRKHNKDYLVALFSFNYEVELDDYWKDSTVIWDSREQ